MRQTLVALLMFSVVSSGLAQSASPPTAGKAAAAVPAVLPGPASRKAVPMPIEAACTLQMAGYTVEVGKDGFLNNLVGGSGERKTRYAENFTFKAPSLTVTDITPTATNEVECTFSGEKRLPGMPRNEKGEIIPDMLKVRYTFDAAEIRMAFKSKLDVDFSLRLGEDAQVVQNLNSGTEAILPVGQQGRGFGDTAFTAARFTYLNGAELLFRYDGPGQRFGFNGGMSRREYSRGQCVPNSDYTVVLRLQPGKPDTKVLAPPQFTIRCAVPGCIFFDPETPAFTLEFDTNEVQAAIAKLGGLKLEGTRIEYRVTDHSDHEVGHGAVPIDFEKDASTLSTNDPRKAKQVLAKEVLLQAGVRGYFAAQFRVVDVKGVLRPVWTERPFSVVQPIKSAAEERAFMGDWKGNDYIRDAFLGLGLMREGVDWDVHVAKGQFKFEKYDPMFKFAKEMREKTGVNSYWMIAGGTHPWAKTPQDMYEVYEAILTRYKDENHWWETLNEPNVYGVTPQLYLEMYLKPLKLAAEKADPEAQIIAPSMCGYGLDFIEELYKLGGKDYFNALSVHPYVGTPYDILFLENFTKLRAIMAKYGDEKKPVWFTESGFGWNNLNEQVYDARQNVRRLLIQDQYDIPKEHDLYYYTSAKGYHKFYLIDFDGSLFPQAVALRALKCRLDGTKYDRHFGFGLRFAHGSVYQAADREVVALWSYDNHRTVEIKTSAAKAEAFDMWGNPCAVAIKDGKLAVPISGEPTYVILPPGATVEPVMDGPGGRNVADLALGAEASASSESSPAALALDGNWSQMGWRDGNPDVFPKWWQVDLAYPASVDRVHLYTGGNLRDLNLMGFSEGKWIKLAEVRGSEDYVLDLKFPPTTLEKVRVDVLGGRRYGEIYECEVYASGHNSGSGALVNHALAANGAIATASSICKMETEVPVADKNSSISAKREKRTIAYTPDKAIDGKFAPGTWPDYTKTVWIADETMKLPQWLEVAFAGKRTVATVLVFVNNFGYWKAAETSISDADLEIWDAGAWKTAGSVQGSKKGVISFNMKTPVQTDKIRLVVKAVNNSQPAAVMEIQAWGPGENDALPAPAQK